MKRKTIFMLAILLTTFLIMIIICCMQKERSIKQAERKEQEQLYYKQNTAFEVCDDLIERQYYHGVDKLRLNRIFVDLYVYNGSQKKYNISINDVVDYLCKEYDSNGKKRVYYIPQNINDYIAWYYNGGEDKIWSFCKGFNKYLLANGYEMYWDISYEEVVVALDEYKNSSEYIPPEQEK